MSGKKLAIVASLMLGIGAFVGYSVESARASGIPPAQAMTYSGVLTDASGTPLTGSKNIQISIYDMATAGTLQCSAGPTAITLVSGGFQLALPDTCTTVVHSTPDLWIEVFVDGTSLGRTKLGAVPYAVEANHAVSADTASAASGTLASTISSLQTLAKKIYTGHANFANGSCSAVGTPCVVDISAAAFQSPPTCTITMTNIDDTGYTEHMVIKSITATALSLWKGQFTDTGTTMDFFYICIGS